MTDQQGAQPSPADSLESEVMDTLLGSFSPEPDAGTEPAPQPAAAQPTGTGAGEGVDAPSPSPEPLELTERVGTEGQPQPAAPEPAKEQPQPAPAAPASQEPPAAAPTPPPVPDERALREASLSAQVDALRRELDQLRASPSAAPQPGQPSQPGAEPTAPESGQPPLQRYNLTLPQPIRDGLASDDPDQQVAAITTLVNDLGTIVHNSVAAQLRQEFTTTLQELSRTASTAETVERQGQTIEQLRDEYYKAFPDHKHPLVLPLIQAESAKLATEFPGLSWDENFRNTLGARVQAAIDQLAGKTPAPADETPPQSINPQPPTRPATMMPTGNRSGGVPGTALEGTDLIEETLSPF